MTKFPKRFSNASQKCKLSECEKNLAPAGSNDTINFRMYGIQLKSTAQSWILYPRDEYCLLNSSLNKESTVEHSTTMCTCTSLCILLHAGCVSRGVYRSASPSRTEVSYWALPGGYALPVSINSVVVICPHFSHLAEQCLNWQTAKRPFWDHVFNLICSFLQKHWSCFGTDGDRGEG